ncbi:glutamine amidotransferase [Corynebacterium urogenitale]
MKFVLLSPRRGEDVIAAEYDDFLTFTGLRPDQLEARVLDEADSELGDFTGVTGVFIGGSPFTITSPVDDVWQPAVSRRLADFVKETLEHRRFPIFAACYGTSMLAHYLGGRVGQTHSEEPGPSRVILTEEASRDPLVRDLPSEFLGMSGHKDSVEQLPPEAVLLATGPTCPVQMYRLGSNVWVSQFHPEMDGARILKRLSFYEDDGYYEEGRAEEVHAQLLGHDIRVSNSLLHRFVEHAASLCAAA